VVAGAANIIIEAMGGFANWQYTRSQALLPKMILLMTATETYPNLREPASTGSPTLERGDKDVHEGYGRLNLDVAVDAVLKTYEIGANVPETLGKPPTLSDISVLGQKLAWARKVQLVPYGRYNFTLSVPSSADFDLYLYNSTGTWYGEPAVVAKSANVTTGGYEQIILTAPYNGTYYLVVKRATAATVGGTFTLESTFTRTCAGDANGDGTVDIFDVGALSAHWYPDSPVGPLGYDWYVDVNGDGAIDVSDVRVVSANWGYSG